MSAHRRTARWRPPFRIAGLTAAALALAVPAALAGPATTATQVISAASPFASCSNGGLQGNHLDAEVEPWLVVDPSHPGTVAAAWQQDRWGDPTEGGAHGLVTYTSTDGGQTGTRSWAPYTTCSGGTAAGNGAYDRASDVWMAYGPDGVLYQSALVFNWLTAANGVTVSRSADGGRTWSTPAYVDRMSRASFTKGDDKEAILADAQHPGWVYAVWDRYSSQSPNYGDGRGQHSSKGPAYFSRSTDGGQTWSSPQAIYARDNGTIGNQLVEQPDGRLLDFFVDYVATNVTNGGVEFAAQLCEISSADHGTTWSASPVVVASLDSAGTRDPVTGEYVRAGDGLFDVAAAPDGTLYLAWQGDTRSPRTDRVLLTRSTDGGATWSAPAGITDSAPATGQQFTPSVDVADDGTVAVTYYDFRNYAGGTTPDTDYWATTSRDGGATWSADTRLTRRTFPTWKAPNAGGLMVGDYEGLAHSGSTFQAAFEIVNDDPANPTDIALASFGAGS